MIAGASSGIGLALAEILLNKGYRVFNISRRICPLSKVESYIADASKSDEFQLALDKALSSVRKLDIFVYSAGHSMSAPLECVKEQDYRYLFEVNFFAALKCMQKVYGIMKKQGGGKIMAISSQASFIPIPYDPYYCASKAAFDMLCLTLRPEFERYGVKIISARLGGVRTVFSYKRNVYRQSNSAHHAAYALYKIEQKGMKTKTAAKKMFSLLKRKNPPAVVTIGTLNKISAFLIKFMPKAALCGIVKKIFLPRHNEQ
mgnify:CR=1 FL=1